MGSSCQNWRRRLSVWNGEDRGREVRSLFKMSAQLDGGLDEVLARDPLERSGE